MTYGFNAALRGPSRLVRSRRRRPADRI